jgi:hypothetical protein
VFLVAALALLVFLIYKRQNDAKNRRAGVEADLSDRDTTEAGSGAEA